MTLQPLDEVRRALSGAWDMGRAGFWWRAAESAAAAGDWNAATNRLLHLADPLDDTPSGAPAWRQLAVAAFDTAVRARDSDLVTAVASQVLGRAFAPHDAVAELVAVFRTAEAADAATEGRALGNILRQRYPHSPWGHYASAHFDELDARLRRVAPLSPARLVEHFERAADLFDDPECGRHARLRAAVARMAYTSHHDAARRALSAASRDAPASEDYWLALGRLHSPFWLDRVRAADWVADTLDAAEATPQAVGRARAVASALLRRLPVRLSDAEQDRLEALGAELDDELRWEVEAQVRGRVAAEQIAERHLAETTAAQARELEEDALPLDGFAALVDAWHGRTPESEPRTEVVARVVDVLLARDDATRALARAVSVAEDPRDLRPVLLALVRCCTTPLDVEDGDIRPPLTEIALHYAARSPAPAGGFLPLARALFDAGLARAGAAVTRRALDDGESGDHDICVAKAIQWAVREGSDVEMLAWLEIGAADSAPEPGAHE